MSQPFNIAFPLPNFHHPAFVDVVATLTDITAAFLGVAEVVKSDDLQYRENFIHLLTLHPLPYLRTLILHIHDPPATRAESDLVAYKTQLPFGVHLFSAPLTTLELRGPPLWNTADEILAMLRGLPGLEMLVLDGVIDKADTPTHPPGSVALPHLAHLELCLGSVMPHAGAVLACLSIPTNVCLRVMHENLDEGGSDEGLLELATQLRCHIPDELYKHLRFGCLAVMDAVNYMGLYHTGSYALVASSPRLDNAAFNTYPHQAPSPPHRLAYDLLWDAEGDTDASVLVRLLSSFLPSFRGIEELSVSHACSGSASWWERIANHLSAVTRIHVAGDVAVGGLLLALADGGRVLFPRLSILRIQRYDAICADAVADTTIVSILTQILSSRADAGSPIEAVVVEECDVTPSMMQALRRHSGLHEIEWDGVTGRRLVTGPGGTFVHDHNATDSL